MLPRTPEKIMPKELWNLVRGYLSFKEDSILDGVCHFFQKPRDETFSLHPIYQDFFEKSLQKLGIINENKITRPIVREFCLLLKEQMIAHLNNKLFDYIEYINAHPTLIESLNQILKPLSSNINLSDIKFRRDNPKYEEYDAHDGLSAIVNAPSTNELNALYAHQLQSQPNSNDSKMAAARLLETIFLRYNTPEIIFSFKNVIHLINQLPKKDRDPLLNALMALNDIEIDPAMLWSILFNAAARCLNILFSANITVKEIFIKNTFLKNLNVELTEIVPPKDIYLKDILIDNLKEIIPPYLPVVIVKNKEGLHVRFTFNSSEKAKESQEKLTTLGLKTRSGKIKEEHIIELNPIEPAAIHLAYLKSTDKVKHITTPRKRKM